MPEFEELTVAESYFYKPEYHEQCYWVHGTHIDFRVTTSPAHICYDVYVKDEAGNRIPTYATFADSFDEMMQDLAEQDNPQRAAVMWEIWSKPDNENYGGPDGLTV